MLTLQDSVCHVGSGSRTRDQLRDELLGRCESQLERSFINFLYEGGYRLPDRAQLQLPELGRPDFFYDEGQVCVYVDGPYHLFPERHARDAAMNVELEDAGYGVVRVTSQDLWPGEIAKFGWVFGGGNHG